jgi:xanthine/uracil permease
MSDVQIATNKPESQPVLESGAMIPRQASPISADDAEKLWQYKMHEEDIFYQRNNFFLVAESMLLTALATLFNAPTIKLSLILVFATLGWLLTVVWIYVSSRQLSVISQIAKESESVFEVYARIRLERAKWPLSSTKLLAYFVPTIVMGTWITVIIISLLKR